MIKPAKLQTGDTIGIVAPAWSCTRVELKDSQDMLKQLGFKVKYSQDLFKKHWSMAGSDQERAGQINQMFADPEIKAVFCAKAGYGSLRTLPYLDRELIRNNPKIFMGYSDLTILLLAIQEFSQSVVFHGPILAGEIKPDMERTSLEYLLKVLTDTQPLGVVEIKSLETIHPGQATGILCGGNLSMLASSLGTPFEIDTEDKILFIEEVSEGLETIDNYLMQLKLAGKFDKVRGLILGRMLDCELSSGRRYKLQDLLKNILHNTNLPLVTYFPSGHRLPWELNITLPLGVQVTLDADQCTLEIKEAAVQ